MSNDIKIIKNKDIQVSYIDKDIEIDEKDQKLIDDYWKSVPDYFTRGKIFVVDKIEEDENNMSISILNSDYAHYIFVRKNPGKARNCYNLWAGILLETLDNKYVVGRMSKITSSEGEYHISGGSCDKNDIYNGKMNYENTMYRELKEEMGLSKENLKNVEMKFMKEAYFTEQDIGIIYKAVVNMTSKELDNYYAQYLQKLKYDNGEIEFDNLAYINKDENSIEDFCLSRPVPEYTRQLLLEDISEK